MAHDMAFNTPAARLRRDRLDNLVAIARQKNLTTEREIRDLVAKTYPYLTTPTRKDYCYVILILLERPEA